jgi:8-oxo-dGTP diphosphatase
LGGKVEAGESVEEAAVRECKEEAGVQIAVRDLIKVGRLEFAFEGDPQWDSVCYVFLTRSWQGEPTETDGKSLC